MVSPTTPQPNTPVIDADHVDFPAVQTTGAFRTLRSTHRSFVFPMTIAFLVWYLLYVILAVYAPGFMSQKVMGNINLGIILGLLQFVSTFAITAAYVSFANRRLDPQATALRQDIEAGAYAHQQEG